MGLCFSSATAQETSGKEYCAVTVATAESSECEHLSPVYTSLPNGVQNFWVRNVYDGDTLTLMDERRVRLLGIDTPEMKPLQQFAEEARVYTNSQCNLKEIWLLVDGKDRYNRLLAHVFVQENSGKYLCVNEGLVQKGFANVYAPRKTKKTFNRDKLLNLQTEARKMKRGIWQSFQDVSVFKTAHGSAYHKRSCSHISRSRNLEELKASEAVDQGLHPCRSCMGYPD